MIDQRPITPRDRELAQLLGFDGNDTSNWRWSEVARLADADALGGDEFVAAELYHMRARGMVPSPSLRSIERKLDDLTAMVAAYLKASGAP